MDRSCQLESGQCSLILRVASSVFIFVSCCPALPVVSARMRGMLCHRLRKMIGVVGAPNLLTTVLIQFAVLCESHPRCAPQREQTSSAAYGPIVAISLPHLQRRCISRRTSSPKAGAWSLSSSGSNGAVMSAFFDGGQPVERGAKRPRCAAAAVAA